MKIDAGTPGLKIETGDPCIKRNFPRRFADYLYLKGQNRTMKQKIQILASDLAGFTSKIHQKQPANAGNGFENDEKTALVARFFHETFFLST